MLRRYAAFRSGRPIHQFRQACCRSLKLRVSTLWEIQRLETQGIITTRSVSEGSTEIPRKTQKHYPSLTRRVGIGTNAQLQNASARDFWQHLRNRKNAIPRLRSGLGWGEMRNVKTVDSGSIDNLHAGCCEKATCRYLPAYR